MKYGIAESTVSVFSLMRLKGVFFITVCCVGIASTWITLDPTLEPHMEQVVREISNECSHDFYTMFLFMVKPEGRDQLVQGLSQPS